MSEPTLSDKLAIIEGWPKHCYEFRPHWVKEALFLLHDIAERRATPPEDELREACAIIYADHLRLENAHYYASKREADREKNFCRRIKRPTPFKKILPPKKYGRPRP